jgi:hypothetical protein
MRSSSARLRVAITNVVRVAVTAWSPECEGVTRRESLGTGSDRGFSDADSRRLAD